MGSSTDRHEGFDAAAAVTWALWLAVVAGWAWLAVASVLAYQTVPHPDADRRAAAG